MQMHNVTPQKEKGESREHSRKSPQHQMKEVQSTMSQQLPRQRSCQDVRMDPRYQEPPRYAEGILSKASPLNTYIHPVTSSTTKIFPP